MRTLKEIDAAVAAEAKARVTELLSQPANAFVFDIMKPQEVMNAQCQARFDDVYRKMHSVLQEVELFLQRDFNQEFKVGEKTTAYKQLLERIQSI